jgi:hypothetical protein
MKTTPERQEFKSSMRSASLQQSVVATNLGLGGVDRRRSDAAVFLAHPLVQALVESFGQAAARAYQYTKQPTFWPIFASIDS